MQDIEGLNNGYQAGDYWYHVNPTVRLHVQWECTRPDPKSSRTLWNLNVWTDGRNYGSYGYTMTTTISIGGVNVFKEVIYGPGLTTHEYTPRNIEIWMVESNTEFKITTHCTANCNHNFDGSSWKNGDRVDTRWVSIPEYNPYVGPGSINSLSISPTEVAHKDDTIDLRWNRPDAGTDGISGYRIYYDAGGGFNAIATTTNTQYETSVNKLNANLSRGTRMYFKVRAYNNSSEAGDSNTVNTIFANHRIKMTAEDVTATSAFIRWYNEIFVKIKKVEWTIDDWKTTNTKQVPEMFTNGFSLENLQPSTSYTVKMRAYAIDSEGGVGESQLTFSTKSPGGDIWTEEARLTSIKVGWKSDVPIALVQYKLQGSTKWQVASSGLNSKQGTFIINGLSFNTRYGIIVSLVPKDTKNHEVLCSDIIGTLDIARINQYPYSWNISEGGTIRATLPKEDNVNYAFSISYKGTDIVSRSNIKFDSYNKYTFKLTNEEQTFIYGITEKDSNPTLVLNLKTYESKYVGTDSKNSTITFDTNAWVKVNNNWKRALVWLKVNNTWLPAIPWVKVGTSWKKIGG